MDDVASRSLVVAPTGADADVVVVGGGPAGVAAAITCARAGRRVVLVDRARFPRDKCCGDGLTTGALRLYEQLGLRPDAVPSWKVVEDVLVRSPSGRTACFPLPRAAGIYAAVATRSDLDAAFLDVARATGVEVIDGHALIGAEPRRSMVQLTVDGMGHLTAPFVVGADGMWSPLRRALGANQPGYLGEWHAFRQYFRNVGPAARDQLWVLFEADLLPGYAWSFPLPGGRANVGFGLQRGPGVSTGDMKHLWPELLARPHVRALLGEDAEAEAPHKAWPIPARIDGVSLHAAGGRALFVGDAAAATDPMTGEGIGQALLTGRLAAQAIVDAGPGADAATVSAAYARAVQRELVPDHRLSRLLIRALRHRKGARGAVRIAGATDWTRRNFARWLFEDYPRAVLATPSRWHRHLLTGPGAFRS